MDGELLVQVLLVDDQVAVDWRLLKLKHSRGDQKYQQTDSCDGNTGTRDSTLTVLAGDSLVEIDGFKAPPETRKHSTTTWQALLFILGLMNWLFIISSEIIDDFKLLFFDSL